MNKLNNASFRKGLFFSVGIALLLLFFSVWLGKIEFFLLLNGNAGLIADYFFVGCTYLGDGLMWIVVLAIVVFVLKRKDVFPLLISCFAFSTLFTQTLKHLFFSGEKRPYFAIADSSLVHIVSFMHPHGFNSFPSGHTATAFCFYLLFCLLIFKKYWVYIGCIIALLVGYSRIYLAQHFPSDVAAGILVAVVSTFFSVVVQRKWNNRKNHKTIRY